MSKHSLICTHKMKLIFRTLTKILIKVALHVKMQKKNTKYEYLVKVWDFCEPPSSIAVLLLCFDL